MEVYTKHRWLVYRYVRNALTPFWQLTGPEHLTDWEAKEWISQNQDKRGTEYRIVEVYWHPEIELIEEVTKK